MHLTWGTIAQVMKVKWCPNKTVQQVFPVQSQQLWVVLTTKLE